MQREAQEFLAAHLPKRSLAERALSWTDFDADFSSKLGEAGLLGITFPKDLGGRGLGALERHVVLEELLAAGAPVAAHWMADRQSGPLLIRYGTEAVRERVVPAIAAGTAHFCIGMSEPEAGSDLAAVRTAATPVDGGYRVTGHKLWSTHVSRCQYMIALVRTAPDEQRHAGLSQLLVDLHGPGIEIRPTVDLLGHEHFGEVTFDEAFIPAENLIGNEGDGWKQVTEELAHERGGPERFLSSFALLEALVGHAAELGDGSLDADIGRLMAQFQTLRAMSLSVASRLESGADVRVEAALVKDLGTRFEQSIPALVARVTDATPMSFGGSALMEVQAATAMLAPSFTLRGGAKEILRGIVAKELLR